MAGEVQIQQYEHLPIAQVSTWKQTQAEDVDPPFRYNALHDVESIWWIAVWVLFCNEVDSPADPTHDPR